MLEESLETVAGFLDGRSVEPPVGKAVPRGGLTIVAFTDIENHTRMMQRLGDQRGRQLLREHERLTKDAIGRHRGYVVKEQGDGFMVQFDSAHAALEWAIELQQMFSSREDEPLRIRVGINAGEPVEEAHDLFGTSVIAASRIAAVAKGGEVIVANVVKELVSGKKFRFSDRGAVTLKGIDEPIHLFQLGWKANLD